MFGDPFFNTGDFSSWSASSTSHNFHTSFNDFVRLGVEQFFNHSRVVDSLLSSHLTPAGRGTNRRNINEMPTTSRRSGRVERVRQKPAEYDLLAADTSGNTASRRRSVHGNSVPVTYRSGRQQWFDTATHRALAPEPIIIPPTYMTLNEIKRIPTRRVTSNLGSNTNNGDEDTDSPPLVECDVCLLEYSSGDLVKTLPCSHEFHKDCIDPWLRTQPNCPKCRSSVRAGLRRQERERKSRTKRSSSGVAGQDRSPFSHEATSRGSREGLARPSNDCHSNSLKMRSEEIVDKATNQLMSTHLGDHGDSDKKQSLRHEAAHNQPNGHRTVHRNVKSNESIDNLDHGAPVTMDDETLNFNNTNLEDGEIANHSAEEVDYCNSRKKLLDEGMNPKGILASKRLYKQQTKSFSYKRSSKCESDKQASCKAGQSPSVKTPSSHPNCAKPPPRPTLIGSNNSKVCHQKAQSNHSPTAVLLKEPQEVRQRKAPSTDLPSANPKCVSAREKAVEAALRRQKEFNDQFDELSI